MTTTAKDHMKIISKLMNITPTVVGEASLVSRTLGHWYQNGRMHAKHIVALALSSIFRCSDSELADELEDKRLLKVLGYKSHPDPSIYCKVRKEIGEEKIGRTTELILQELYRNRFVTLMAIDSTFLPYYFETDTDAAFGYVTLKKKEQKLLKDKTQKGIKKGYKLHLITEVILFSHNMKRISLESYAESARNFTLCANL